jgi:type II secretion system protein G
MRNQKALGFTLIELLVVVAIIGMIVAITIPNLLAAIDRGAQKRTMADMRSIGSAVEAYAVDNSAYPIASNAAMLAAEVAPHYIKAMPMTDGWDHTYVVDAVATTYTITSRGRDGVPSGCVTGALTRQYDADICFSTGLFTQHPDGIQQ